LQQKIGLKVLSDNILRRISAEGDRISQAAFRRSAFQAIQVPLPPRTEWLRKWPMERRSMDELGGLAPPSREDGGSVPFTANVGHTGKCIASRCPSAVPPVFTISRPSPQGRGRKMFPFATVIKKKPFKTILRRFMMARAAKPIPQGFHTVTPTLVVQNAAKAIEFYKKALGAQERMRMSSPDGKVSHAELQIGDSIVFLSDELPNMGSKSPQSVGTNTGSLFLYVEDVDKDFKRAVDAGGKSTMPLADMFWGDRFGTFVDPFGHTWGLATRKEDLSQREMEDRAKDFYAQMAQKKSA
jgi:PhnB protein